MENSGRHNLGGLPPRTGRGGRALPVTRFGAIADDLGTTFRAFCTAAPEVAVRLIHGDGFTRVPLTLASDGVFESYIPGVSHGQLYLYEVGDKALPDPYSRFQPDGVHGPSMVVKAHHRYRHEPVSRPLEEQVLYELHVGTFTPEGTYAAAQTRLPELVALGVSTIELMPLASFPGSRGWGYDGVALFAPFAPYGTPDDLRAFIDAAHGFGLGVVLDVVYNHFGPAGNYLRQFSERYFSSEIKNAWGDAPNFGDHPMRQLVVDNALYWLTEFGFDGLRLDATHAIVDPSSEPVIAELARAVRNVSPPRLLFAEDERNDPTLVTRFGLDAIWADDFHHQVRVTLTRESDGYYAAYQPGAAGIADAINHGWLYRGQAYPLTGKSRGAAADALPAPAFVYCLQNHDQVGNRARGDRLSSAVSLDDYCAVSTLLLFLPMTPLLFQGQEWAASTPFQFFTDHEPELGKLVSEGRAREFAHFAEFSQASTNAGGEPVVPDPQAETTFTRSKLDWSERTQPDHARVLALYETLLALRREPAFVASAGERPEAWAVGDVLIVRRGRGRDALWLVLNFSPQPTSLSAVLSADERGARAGLSPAEGGSGVHVLFASTPKRPDSSDTVPPRAALVLLAGAAALG